MKGILKLTGILFIISATAFACSYTPNSVSTTKSISISSSRSK